MEYDEEPSSIDKENIETKDKPKVRTSSMPRSKPQRLIEEILCIPCSLSLGLSRVLKFSLITMMRHIRYNLITTLSKLIYNYKYIFCCCLCFSLFSAMGKKSGRTNKQIKWFRHCSRQQTKRGKDGDTRFVVLVEDNDTRIVLKPSQKEEELASLSMPGPSRKEESASQHKPSSEIEGPSTTARGEEEEDVEGDDVLSLYADSDSDI